MTTYYKLEIIKTGATLKLSFRGGKFLRLEHVSGKLNESQLRQIGMLIPPDESQIENYTNNLSEKVLYTKIEKGKSLYTLFVTGWINFYTQHFGYAPKFSPTDGASLKSIISYLKTLTSSEDEAFALWEAILYNWKQLDEFHQKNTDLKYINSRINVILQNVKRINTKKQAGVSGEYLQSVIRDLQS